MARVRGENRGNLGGLGGAGGGHAPGDRDTSLWETTAKQKVP